MKDEKAGEVKWKDRETIWHDVLVSAPMPPILPVILKDDAVIITGGLAYKPFKDENGNTKRQARKG